MLARTLNQKPLIGANFSPSPKSAVERAAERWFLKKKPLLSTTTASDKTVPGQYFDQETNLHYNYYRYYDPQLGRYITSDPVGLDGGLNSYLYANANSLRYIDRLGLSPLFPYKPDPRINRPGPIDQSGRNGGRTGNPISGPFSPKPKISDKIAEFLAKQGLKKGLDLLLPGLGKVIGNARAVGIGGILFSPNLNEGEFGNDAGDPSIGDDPVFSPLPDSNSPDSVSDPILKLFCELNPEAPNCRVERACPQ